MTNKQMTKAIQTNEIIKIVIHKLDVITNAGKDMAKDTARAIIKAHGNNTDMALHWIINASRDQIIDYMA